ncbi:MAG: sugar ABC transporter permease [Roseiflexaceae bacterium]
MSQIANTTPRSAATPWLRQLFNGESLLAFGLILPSLIGLCVFYIIPAVRGLMISFTNWDLLREPRFVGLANYEKLIADEQFWRALVVTALYVLFNIPLQTLLAIGIAVLMQRLTQSLFVRGVLLLPWLLPNVVVALLWLWMLDPQLGMINQFLGLFGISRLPFLGSPDQALASIAGINIWRHVGYTALLIFAGLQTIPKDVNEAAAIDGASEMRTFWSITMPLLRPVLVFVLVTSIIGSFQIFDTIAITTKGGPVDATRVIYWYVYEYAFNRFNMGYATTLAFALFLILLAITVIQLRYFRADSSDLA